jgi:tRNA-binding EMAP/Myf-like protein
MASTRYQVFNRSLVCAVCGLAGSLFLLERQENHQEGTAHFNLYAEDDGDLILMTKDHILPFSKGGRGFKNYQTMCEPCNAMKSSSALANEEIRIIANLEEVYEVDNNVIVALTGSILKDGTKVKEMKVRGLPSYGMAMGLASAPVGTDLSKEYCHEELSKGAQLIRWPEIERLATLCRGLDQMKENLGDDFSFPKVIYRPKVKLHGSNAAIQVHPDGSVYAQSRTHMITPGDDNAGFAAWVEKNIDYWKDFVHDNIITFFGEWVGPGINKSGTAICKIERKAFAVFAIQIGGTMDIPYYQVEPVVIADWLWPHFRRKDSKDVLAKNISFTDHDDIFVIPWVEDYEFELDFNNRGKLAAAVEPINQLVAEVEKLDPWVDEVFNIQGTGEGVVLYPVKKDGAILTTREEHAELMFKAKGEKHKVVKQKKPVQIDPEVAKNTKEFVELFVTPARLEQGVEVACGGQADMRKMGDFLKWIGGDVKKESVAELEASKLDWKSVSKAIASAASKWFKEEANKI